MVYAEPKIVRTTPAKSEVIRCHGAVARSASCDIARLCKENKLSASHFTAIGAFSDCTLGFFERDRKDYKRIPIKGQVEVVSLTGNIVVTENGEHKLHAHIVVGKDDGTAHAGHLLEGYVWPTLEVVLIESPENLRRRLDQETGLPLISID